MLSDLRQLVFSGFGREVVEADRGTCRPGPKPWWWRASGNVMELAVMPGPNPGAPCGRGGSTPPVATNSLMVYRLIRHGPAPLGV